MFVFYLFSRLTNVRAALAGSAIFFAYAHGVNPGVNYIWMLRLVAAGLLLGYSVVRTASLSWAIGYHAGWNWGSAPLFGAAGSGYLNEGHIFTYSYKGSDLITGGSVGPEGSLFAFFAVLIAAVILVGTFRVPHPPRMSKVC